MMETGRPRLIGRLEDEPTFAEYMLAEERTMGRPATYLRGYEDTVDEHGEEHVIAFLEYTLAPHVLVGREMHEVRYAIYVDGRPVTSSVLTTVWKKVCECGSGLQPMYADGDDELCARCYDARYPERTEAG